MKTKKLTFVELLFKGVGLFLALSLNFFDAFLGLGSRNQGVVVSILPVRFMT
jgi:hypothetical protein